MSRLRPALRESVEAYGSAVDKYMPEMKKELEAYQKRKSREVAHCNKAWKMVMENIDKSVELKSIKPYLKDNK